MRVKAPFIKWVGGKRQLLPKLVNFLPKNGYKNYFEPFLGGGALFLRLSPNNAVISDLNEELINTWQVIRDNLSELKKILKVYENNDSKEFYLDIRSVDRDGRIVKMNNVERAARFIYINKAGYNGLWRVNSNGQNNVPYGAHKKLNLISNSLDSISEYLISNNIELISADYKKIVKNAGENDFVYFDPPYVPVNITSAFTQYTKDGFGLVQQEELRDTIINLNNKGVKIMLSNSDVPLVHDLYKDSKFKFHEVKATRVLNSNSSKRGKVGEVIITNY
ncbi:Dam family site-specific DNA-(adenine-N6)-methyltransferase (plasmid) [Fructilactobacillus ixorae]|uniref:Site-specific DNA-methyltransferase (adenine-specific) n=1 Tax=Fructilactobacillus ixorae TaxID=1750535 RepID=A0ABY5C5I2_9LACO|nr:Dam family site-specific DNA-(adenine-N6)-methyltransferase [Fructilactobacillus ixorae]USS94024.1 Dam family site-specific DNA-(adenine-N6)-methyltransferase [Fructilactobacillus ixorae]